MDTVQIFNVKVRSSCINRSVLMAKLCFERLDGIQWALPCLRQSGMCLSQRMPGYAMPGHLM